MKALKITALSFWLLFAVVILLAWWESLVKDGQLLIYDLANMPQEQAEEIVKGIIIRELSDYGLHISDADILMSRTVNRYHLFLDKYKGYAEMGKAYRRHIHPWRKDIKPLEMGVSIGAFASLATLEFIKAHKEDKVLNSRNIKRVE